MKTFKLIAESHSFASLVLVTEDREWTILSGIALGAGLRQRVLAYCNCAVAGMDIAQPTSRTFVVENLEEFEMSEKTDEELQRLMGDPWPYTTRSAARAEMHRRYCQD